MKVRFILLTLIMNGVVPLHAHAQVYGTGITRADFVRLLIEEKRIPATGGTNCFRDVTNQHFASTICTAKIWGFITGDPSGRFRPNDAIAFVEAAAMVVRAESEANGLREDTYWYRPYMETVARWNAIPLSLPNMFGPVTFAEAVDLIDRAKNRGRTDRPEEDRDTDTDLDIAVSDPRPEPGDRVTFRIHLRNLSNRDVQNMKVRADLGPDMEYVSSSNSGDEFSDVVEWDRVDLDRNERVTLNLVVDIADYVQDGDAVRLKVTADGHTVIETLHISEDDDDNDGSVDIDIHGPSGTVEPGETVTYRITLLNREHEDIRIFPRAILDADMVFVSASNAADVSGDEVEWDSFVLDEDEEEVLSLTVRIDDSARDGDRVTLRIEAGDAVASDVTDIEDDDSFSGDGEVRISITDTPDPVWPGDELLYRISLENLENDDLRIDVRALLDEDTSLLSATGGAEMAQTDEILWRNIRINEDSTEILILRVRVLERADEGDTLRLRVETEDDEHEESTRVR